MQVFSRTSLLLLLSVSALCGAYIQDTDVAPTPQEGRRFGWVINWLNDRGSIGQVFANVIVALFVLPPLGPFVCSFFENCDSLKIRARTFLRALATTLPPDARRSRAVQEDFIRVMERLDSAYEKYT